MAKGSTEHRRAARVPFERLRTEAEVHGLTMPVRITDLSELGVRLVIESDVRVEQGEEIRIAVGKISPNIRGRVRWADPSPDNPGHLQLGVEFESFVLEPPAEDEMHDLLDAWREVSRTYSVYESFLHILDVLDFEIVDGKIDDIGEAVFSVTVWLDQRLGPLNLWSVIREPDDAVAIQVMVERHAPPKAAHKARHAQVERSARQAVTLWEDGRAYLYGDSIVVEYMGQEQTQIDLLQKLTVLLGKRIQFWSKLLMKNIAIGLLGDELERHMGK